MEAQNSKEACFSGTPSELKHMLFLKQRALLDTFLAHGAITQAQHDKSLHDLKEKMGETGEASEQ